MLRGSCRAKGSLKRTPPFIRTAWRQRSSTVGGNQHSIKRNVLNQCFNLLNETVEINATGALLICQSFAMMSKTKNDIEDKVRNIIKRKQGSNQTRFSTFPATSGTGGSYYMVTRPSITSAYVTSSNFSCQWYLCVPDYQPVIFVCTGLSARDICVYQTISTENFHWRVYATLMTLCFGRPTFMYV